MFGFFLGAREPQLAAVAANLPIALRTGEGGGWRGNECRRRSEGREGAATGPSSAFLGPFSNPRRRP